MIPLDSYDDRALRRNRREAEYEVRSAYRPDPHAYDAGMRLTERITIAVVIALAVIVAVVQIARWSRVFG